MKIRTTFVSNSSSSSFAILKKYLSEDQIGKIADHAIVGKEMGMAWAEEDAWTIRSNDEMIGGETWMDNFDMETFLEKIGVPMDKVEWGDSPGGLMMDEIVLPMMLKGMKADYIERLEKDVEAWKKEVTDRQATCGMDNYFNIAIDSFLRWAKAKNE